MITEYAVFAVYIYSKRIFEDVYGSCSSKKKLRLCLISLEELQAMEKYEGDQS